MAVTAVVHVDDIFAVGQEERSDTLCGDLNRTIPVKNLGKSNGYAGCHRSRDRDSGTLAISQEIFAQDLLKKFRVTSIQSVSLIVGVSLEEFDEMRKLRAGLFVNLLVV